MLCRSLFAPSAARAFNRIAFSAIRNGNLDVGRVNYHSFGKSARSAKFGRRTPQWRSGEGSLLFLVPHVHEEFHGCKSVNPASSMNALVPMRIKVALFAPVEHI